MHPEWAAEPEAIIEDFVPASKPWKNTSYTIVWLNPVSDEEMDAKRTVGSHAGFGVRFGVHFPTELGRFGGFQRFWRLTAVSCK